ncbi:phenylacetate--CoA ligase family protein [Streptomyces sp. NPDC048106]|uniref:phenylacetate--CoA ligase family protein n=1 Tax=Streptomyces sp. NPDC048106 TaxID=3155750 RepID=UPI003451168F
MTDYALNEMFSFARKHSPFYQDLYADLPESVDDVSQLPIIDHGEFWAANTLTGNRVLTSPLSEAIVYKSGGTTGSPKFSCYTRTEWDHVARTLGTGLVGMGLRDGHRVANLFYVGELYASFFMFQDSLTQVPVETVRLPIGGATAPEAATRMLAEFSAQVIGGTPTTMCSLADHLTDRGETVPSVELMFFAGEPVFEDQRRLLRTAFPNARISPAAYVSVDAGPLGHPVGEEGGTFVYRVPQDRGIVLEIVDGDTGEPIRTNGRPGRILKTDLYRRLMPLLRYPVGDRGEWVDAEQGLFRILGRHEEGARIGPVTLYVEDLRKVVDEADETGAVTGVQMVVRRWDGRDGLVLRLVARPGFTDTDAIAAKVVDRLDSARAMYAESVAAGFIHPMVIEWTGYDQLAVNRRTGKLLRVVDERPSDAAG